MIFPGSMAYIRQFLGTFQIPLYKMSITIHIHIFNTLIEKTISKIS